MAYSFIKYRDVFEASELAEFTQLLNSHQIEFEAEDFDDSLGSIYGNSPVIKGTTIKIRERDFRKVDALLNAEAANLLDTVDKDYHLFDFNNEELLEIIAKPDEWSAFDYQVAKSILASRGMQLGEERLIELKQNRLEILALPEPPQTWLIWWGYALAFMGGFIGLFIGWHLWTSKKILPNGKRICNYTRSDRKHGRIIFVLGAILSATFLIYKLYLDEVTIY
ncbi:MAG TPA: hypothetical protein VF473_01135 [Cyclobacteriaceae bacterium]